MRHHHAKGRGKRQHHPRASALITRSFGYCCCVPASPFVDGAAFFPRPSSGASFHPASFFGVVLLSPTTPREKSITPPKEGRRNAAPLARGRGGNAAPHTRRRGRQHHPKVAAFHLFLMGGAVFPPPQVWCCFLSSFCAVVQLSLLFFGCGAACPFRSFVWCCLSPHPPPPLGGCCSLPPSSGWWWFHRSKTKPT